MEEAMTVDIPSPTSWEGAPRPGKRCWPSCSDTFKRCCRPICWALKKPLLTYSNNWVLGRPKWLHSSSNWVLELQKMQL